MKRLFDILLSLMGLLLLSPVFLIVSIMILIDSKGGVFYRQVRVGKNNNKFRIFKFRTMHINADKLGLLTIGGKDPRVTRLGYYFRKYKIDELPQLLNVLIGDMSFVGPRPEVEKYVKLYTKEQQEVLKVRPGITDLASIEYRDENNILSNKENPEKYYVEVIMPHKLKINIDYIKHRTLFKDIKIILKTLSIL